MKTYSDVFSVKCILCVSISPSVRSLVILSFDTCIRTRWACELNTNRNAPPMMDCYWGENISLGKLCTEKTLIIFCRWYEATFNDWLITLGWNSDNKECVCLLLCRQIERIVIQIKITVKLIHQQMHKSTTPLIHKARESYCWRLLNFVGRAFVLLQGREENGEWFCQDIIHFKKFSTIDSGKLEF